jgi:phosphoenolpyruvate carboxylase
VPRSDIHFPPKHEALRDDVHALGALVGEILAEQGGDALLKRVEMDRVAAIKRREGNQDAARELDASVRDRPPALARDLVRAFSTWFQVVNMAERVHRIRRRRDYFLKDSHRPQPGGVEDAIARLKAQGLSLKDVLELLSTLRIEPVFAAHSTDSMRKTLLHKQQRITSLMLDRLDPTLTPHETRTIWSSIRIELTAAWQTEEHPRERLTVGDEREQVLFYLVEILYRVVPPFYEELAQALEKLYGVPADSIELPSMLHFGSWVGGDMDGNPDVHAKTIRETLSRQQHVIINRYFEEVQTVAHRLSQSGSRVSISPELAKRIEQYMTRLPSAKAITPARHDRMPYRVFLAQVGERLRATFEGRANGYEKAHQFREDIRLVAASLQANKGTNAGLYYVRRLMRRIDTFGFHLATLDVRQHASVLHQVIARGYDDPQWMERTSAERRELLADALEHDRGPTIELDALGKRNLAVFEALMQGRHRYGREAVGYFIVSGTKGADDVLAALLLTRWAAVYDKQTGEVALDIAPQFESVNALEHCGQILQDLLADPLYRRHLQAHGREQCVLLGYSDSNKEVGTCASRMAIHQAQHSLAQILHADGDRTVIFHARGASPARGGGRIDSIVMAAPAGAVNGVLRIREQGETIKQGYGLRPIAMRSLERAFNALSLTTSAAKRGKLAPDSPAFLTCATTLADASRQAYRGLAHSGREFFDYFRAVTPIDVIERMQIGSRSIHRDETKGIDGLLPVPWVFAWTQTRHMIPGWYGAGTGLSVAMEQYGLNQLREIYANWFFLRNLLDDVETMLARTDLDIAEHYQILAPEPLRHFFDNIRTEYELAREHILAIKDSRNLLDTEPTLQRAIQLRNPYVDPMNLMQVDLLQRWRATGLNDRDLFEALLASIAGIAQGLQSTG